MTALASVVLLVAGCHRGAAAFTADLTRIACETPSPGLVCVAATVKNVGDATGHGTCRVLAIRPSDARVLARGPVIRIPDLRPGHSVVRETAVVVPPPHPSFGLAWECTPALRI